MPSAIEQDLQHGQALPALGTSPQGKNLLGLQDQAEAAQRNDAESSSSTVPAGFRHDNKRMKSRKGFAIFTTSIPPLFAMGKEAEGPEAVPSIGPVTQAGHHSTRC